MVGDQKDVSPEKRTGFTHEGKEIVLSKQRGRPPTGRAAANPNFFSDKKKIEAVTIYAVTGNVSEVERITGVSRATFKKWQQEEWYLQLIEQLRNENDGKFESVATEILNKLTDAINDRVERGDYVVLKDGSMIRKPVTLRDLIGAMMITFDKRQMVRGRPTSRSESVSIEGRLEKIIDQFTQLSKKSTADRSPVGTFETPQPTLVEETEDAPEQTAT